MHIPHLPLHARWNVFRKEPDPTRLGLGTVRECFAELDDFVQSVAKLLEARHGNDDRVMATVDLFDDSQESSSWILFQVKREVFPFDPEAVVLQMHINSGRASHRSLCGCSHVLRPLELPALTQRPTLSPQRATLVAYLPRNVNSQLFRWKTTIFNSVISST